MSDRSAGQLGYFLMLSLSLGKVARYAQQKNCWVLVVCPDGSVLTECLHQLAVIVSSQDLFSGRTAKFIAGGKLSIVEASENSFIPSNILFVVDFLGWTAKHSSSEMLKWQTKSTSIWGISPD